MTYYILYAKFTITSPRIHILLIIVRYTRYIKGKHNTLLK